MLGDPGAHLGPRFSVSVGSERDVGLFFQSPPGLEPHGYAGSLVVRVKMRWRL